jgi:lysophospholipase L1-like esterase
MTKRPGSLILLFIMMIYLPGCITDIANAAPYDSVKAMTPFWIGDTQYDESVLMVSTNGKPAEASLLYPADQIMYVKNARMTITYKEAVDWNYTGGKLVLTSGSKCPYLTNRQLYPDSAGNTMNKVGGGYVLFHEGSYFHDLQLVITYRKKPAYQWQGPVPQYSESSMPKTIGKLKKGLPLTIVLYGCSTSAGANASANSGVPPYMPSFGQLVVNRLSEAYKSKITYYNPSVGGKTAAWGAENVRSLVSSKKPDLVIIEFGMNDAYNGAYTPEVFRENTLIMINDVRSVNPEAEFILICPLHANPEAALFEGKQALFATKLEELAGTGIKVVNMTGVHAELLKHKKLLDLTGNNINHPNDYLIRWFAQEITYTLVNSGAATGSEPVQ